MEFKWFVARCRLLWKFARLIPQARGLELEWQAEQQKRDDMAFAGDRDKYLYHQGFCDGIKWTMNKVKTWPTDTN